MSSVKEQYEKYPYPPVPLFALPRPKQGKAVRYEHAALDATHDGIRILVAGCGTLEPLVVAQQHPRAAEIVSVDLSTASLRRARVRTGLARCSPSYLLGIRRFARNLRWVQADLNDWNPELPFDYILASNVLHHVPDPAKLLHHLASQLRPGGLLRIVTYPKASRIWMRATSRYLLRHGISREMPDLLREARRQIQKLPAADPVRMTFEHHPEARTATGIVDAFLHARENPLSPLEWREASQRAGLELLTEDQDEGSRSTFVDEIAPELQPLSAWIKLQILDDFLELCANPVLWLRKGPYPGTAPDPLSRAPLVSSPSRSLAEEVQGNLESVRSLLQDQPISLETLFQRFREKVGPRVSPDDPERVLPGLALTDYDLPALLDGRLEKLSG